jgi:hypothetical protein
MLLLYYRRSLSRDIHRSYPGAVCRILCAPHKETRFITEEPERDYVDSGTEVSTKYWQNLIKIRTFPKQSEVDTE